jgi:hypothetical protein
MSFVITMYVREGIVMASDSRITLNQTTHEADKSIVKLADLLDREEAGEGFGRGFRVGAASPPRPAAGLCSGRQAHRSSEAPAHRSDG